MSATASATLTSKLLRKDPSLPVFVVIPGRVVAPWKLEGTTVVEGSANGHSFGRRNIKAWGKGSDDWFLEFTAPFCKAAGLNVGDAIKLNLILADTSLPPELEGLLADAKAHARSWSKLSERQRREASEHVRAAKTEAGRQRRAAAVIDKLCGP
jgi:hypothetical protein